MEYFKVGQQVRLSNYGSGKDLTGEVRGMGTEVYENGELNVVYLVRLDDEFRGYVAQHNKEADSNYISTLVVAADGMVAI